MSDSIFCIHCALFVSQEKRKNLNIHNDWYNVIERQSIHEERKYYKHAIKDSHNLINRFETPEGTIDYHSYTAYLELCKKHPKILEVVIRAVHFHGRQGLALRGHRETLHESDENQNLGNFLTYLEELKSYCLS